MSCDDKNYNILFSVTFHHEIQQNVAWVFYFKSCAKDQKNLEWCRNNVIELENVEKYVLLAH